MASPPTTRLLSATAQYWHGVHYSGGSFGRVAALRARGSVPSSAASAVAAPPLLVSVATRLRGAVALLRLLRSFACALAALAPLATLSPLKRLEESGGGCSPFPLSRLRLTRPRANLKALGGGLCPRPLFVRGRSLPH